MTKKPKRPTHREADPDEIEEQEFEEEEAMADEPEAADTPKGEPKHPDPKGKMVSYAPGFGPHPETGEPYELPKDEEPKEKE